MTLIIDPQTGGIAGNMIIGALVDLGANPQELKEIMESVTPEFGKVKVSFNKVNKHGIDATYCNVELLSENKHIHYKELISKIDDLKLDKKVKETSKNIFKRIAIAESEVHGKSLDEIHFHEVGASDAVADVIGSVYAYYSLNLDKEKIIGLPIALGGGRVKTAHGTLPVPAPAVLNILKNINCVGGPVDSELATPTGCAIYAELCDEFKKFIPTCKTMKVGYGAGKKDFNFPNVLRVIKTSEITENDQIDVIETNIDHLTGEEIGYLFDKLLEEGASDVSITPIIMKKNRQGSLLKVISKREKRDHLIDVMFKEIGTLGIRITPNLHRGIAKREFIKKSIDINGMTFEVTFKVAYVNGKIISNRPEYNDLLNISTQTEIPLIELKRMISDYND
ncbi:nickel pincer cofactor biosynthesis protein LarC [uncultured Methanobrevibacter sp.]|uniref:nickel pincer cofactor biosynthesis protein LarC n=1 Tax=uncultured Methanobrevibacter sp. TaxID=253161 RepID=UPI0026397B77|nr:nickel pincer cofactor biosynthesis protein LarC [uncultured Methanobrevibacter sp.]